MATEESLLQLRMEAYWTGGGTLYSWHPGNKKVDGPGGWRAPRFMCKITKPPSCVLTARVQPLRQPSIHFLSNITG
ncbi:hypothetical protein V8C40DRAFT_240999 [Trichoderma camerunense]